MREGRGGEGRGGEGRGGEGERKFLTTHGVGTNVEVAGVQRMEWDTVGTYCGHSRGLT